jgi:hypothetical protein
MLNNLMFGFALDSNFRQIKHNFIGDDKTVEAPKKMEVDSIIDCSNLKQEEITYYRINNLYKKTFSSY